MSPWGRYQPLPTPICQPLIGWGDEICVFSGTERGRVYEMRVWLPPPCTLFSF